MPGGWVVPPPQQGRSGERGELVPPSAAPGELSINLVRGTVKVIRYTRLFDAGVCWAKKRTLRFRPLSSQVQVLPRYHLLRTMAPR